MAFQHNDTIPSFLEVKPRKGWGLLNPGTRNPSVSDSPDGPYLVSINSSKLSFNYYLFMTPASSVPSKEILAVAFSIRLSFLGDGFP